MATTSYTTPKPVRKPLSKRIRFNVFRRDAFTCKYCGAHGDIMLYVDHVIPVSRGGTNDTSNLVTACFDCNAGKGAMLLEPLCPSRGLYLDEYKPPRLKAIPAVFEPEPIRPASPKHVARIMRLLVFANDRAFHEQEFGEAAKMEDAVRQMDSYWGPQDDAELGGDTE